MEANSLKNEPQRIRVILMSDIHYCNEWYGITPEMKREMLCADLEREFEQNPYQALLLLGDYSLDHWVWHTKGSYLTQGVSNTKRFVEHCLPRMAPQGIDVRMIAGNHEQYGEALWTELTGFSRSDHIVCGSVLFILLDTFGGNLDPVEHSDGTYIGANVAGIHEMMSRYPDKKVVLCAHWFDMEKESEEFRTLLSQEERIVCLFCGHNHISRVASTGAECGNKPLVYTGHYSYSGEGNPIHCLNGYREVLITDTGITSKYIVPSHTYTMGNVKFTTEYAEQDEVEIHF
jgi:predicted phosphodiesterase